MPANEPVYPHPMPQCIAAGAPEQWPGLTKREYMATRIYAAMLCDTTTEWTRSEIIKDLGLNIEPADYNPWVHWPAFVAKRAVEHADALITALDKKDTTHD